MNTTKISIQLITYNAKQYLEQCLNSVASQTFLDFSLYVFDNASTDNSVEIINDFRKKNPKIIFTFIPSKKNLGFSVGHNILLRLHASKYCVLLNQDVILDQDFLKNAVNFLDKHANYSSVSPKILRLTQAKKTRIIDSLGIRIKKTLQAVDIGAGIDDKKLNFKPIFDIFGPSGASPIYRRAALDEIAYKYQNGQVEYLDEDFFMYKDDVDLAYRLTFLGWKSACVQNVISYHARTARTVSQCGLWYQIAKNRLTKSQFVNYLSYRNHWFLYYKDIPMCVVGRYLSFIIYYELKKIIFLVFFERQTLLAFKEIWQKRKLMHKKRNQLFSQKKISYKELRRRMFLNQ